MFAFMFVFSVYYGWRGSALWWSAIAVTCWGIVGIAATIIDRVKYGGMSITEVLQRAEWAKTLGHIAFFVVFFCLLQILVRYFVRRQATTIANAPKL